MESINDIILAKWDACANDAQRWALLNELRDAKDALYFRVLKGDKNLRQSLTALTGRLDAMVFGRTTYPVPSRRESFSHDPNEIPAYFAHAWALLMLRNDGRRRATEELRAASAGQESLLHEWRIEDAADQGKAPLEISCGICRAAPTMLCTNKIARYS